MIFPHSHITRETSTVIIRELYFLKEINSIDVLAVAEKTNTIVTTREDIETLPFFTSIMATPPFQTLRRASVKTQCFASPSKKSKPINPK